MPELPQPRPIEPGPSPLATMAQLMGIKNAQQEQAQRAALAPLQRQEAQQQVQIGQQNIAARQALNAAYSGAITKDENGNPTIDETKLAQGLAQGPAAYQTPEVMKGIVDFHKSRVDLQSSVTKLQTEQADMLGSAASAVKAAGYDPTLAHSLLDTLPQSPQLNHIRAQIDNPAALKQLIDTTIQNSPKQRELMAAQQQADARTLSSQTEAARLKGQTDPNSPLYAPTSASVAMGTAPGAAQIQAGEVKQAGAKAAAEENARMPGELALARQRQALSQGDPNAAAQLLINGDATLSELKARGATPDFIANTLATAHQLSNGQYNAQRADADFQVAKSPANVAFFGSAKSLTDRGGTLDQLAAAAKDLPGGHFPALNSIADWERVATGDGPIAKAASLALGVADDYSKVMGGGQGSDTSRLQALNLLKLSQSPDQRAGGIEGIRGAVNSQKVSRIGNNPILQRMYGDAQPAAAQPASARPAAGSAQPTVGTVKTFPNGAKGVWDGHGWAVQ
ncbi:hypothetical protein ACFPT7_02200 [Acidicapsa dinghuensis]|uniref:Uncharacterized protein n=1 Tax=Acidicapsa dinghuensis TaxID=2218256 RepID=A0ABW1E9U4_9BACT|nr:hypothetical protein [Acidicapsa dinghuensis]